MQINSYNVYLILTGDLIPVFDDRILAEYREVLTRARFGFDPNDVADLLRYFEAEGEHITARPIAAALPDPDDLPFLEVALTAQVDALVTGNIRHYPSDLCKGVTVLPPAAFITLWQQSSS